MLCVWQFSLFPTRNVLRLFKSLRLYSPHLLTRTNPYIAGLIMCGVSYTSRPTVSWFWVVAFTRSASLTITWFAASGPSWPRRPVSINFNIQKKKKERKGKIEIWKRIRTSKKRSDMTVSSVFFYPALDSWEFHRGKTKPKWYAVTTLQYMPWYAVNASFRRVSVVRVSGELPAEMWAGNLQ